MGIHEYRGWRSTKLHLTLIAMGLMTGAFLGSSSKEALFPALCTALVGAVAAYHGADVGARFAAGRAADSALS